MPDQRRKARAGALIPQVEIDLGDGRVRRVMFDFNSLVEFEDATGLSIQGLNPNQLKARHLRAFVWAGLLRDDPEITEETVGRLLHGGNVVDVLQTVMQAWQSAQAPGETPAGRGRALTAEDEAADPLAG